MSAAGNGFAALVTNPSISGCSFIGSTPHDHQQNPNSNNPAAKPPTSNPSAKKRRNLPGTPDPDAEVIALSPKTLMATNRFVCEICNKGFQRDQNLQLHRRGHNLPWKLRQRSKQDIIKKKVYICPEKTCVHHDPSRALGDLTGIKKHFSRKHGEKKWKCEKCSKKYAVQSDWKAHTKTCGTREYKCDCGTLFSRKDSFITHRAFCDALAEESARLTTTTAPPSNLSFKTPTHDHQQQIINNNKISTNSGQVSAGGGGVFSHRFMGQYDAGNNNASQFNPFYRPEHFNMTPGANNFTAGLPADLVQMGSTNLFGSTSSIPNFDGINNQFSSFQDHHPAIGASTSTTNTNALSLSPLPFEIKDHQVANNNKTAETMMSSLYNSIDQNNQPTSSTTPMSATALLQKAAQIGSTRSSSNNNNPSSIFSTSCFGSMMMMNSSPPASSSSSPPTISRNNNNNELQQMVSNNSHGFIGGNTMSGIGSDIGSNLSSLATQVTNIDQLMMQSSNGMGDGVTKIQRGLHGLGQNGLTRDFLGMGSDQAVASGGRGYLPSEVLDLASFASMGNTSMGNLSHFTSK